MIDQDNQSAVIEEEAVTFTPAQQTKIDAIILERLAQERRISQRDLDAVRAEALRQVGALRGDVSAESYVTTMRAKEDRDSISRAELGRLFGPGSNSKMANDLARSDYGLYKRLKEQAQVLGLLNPVPKKY
jgi:hypothetical protein